MERMIKVTGKGSISVRPDTTRVMITLNEVFPSYEKTVEESTKRKTALTKDLEGLGFEKSDLKTMDFNVDPEYESYQDKEGIWQRKLVGFRYYHTMKLEFPIDNELLGKLFYVLAHCPGTPEFRVMYLLADPEPVKNQLLGKAVADAKEKAAILADAAGVCLGEIVTIDYSWGEVEFVSREYDFRMENAALKSSVDGDSYDIDIESDDIRTSDTVTVVWGIS